MQTCKKRKNENRLKEVVGEYKKTEEARKMIEQKKLEKYNRIKVKK